MYADGNGSVATCTYSNMDDLTKYTKPDGKPTNMVYDQYGRLTRWHQFYKLGDDPSYYQIWRHERWFVYDQLSRMTSRTDYYLQGTWDGMGWDKDADNPPTLHRTASRTTTCAYDQSSLLTKTTYPSTATDCFYYNALGRLTRSTASGIDLQYGYDTAERLTRLAYNYDSGTVTKAITYAYDAASHLTQKTNSNGTNIGYAYDLAGLLTLVTEGGNARGTYYYDAAGKRTHLVYGNASYTDYLYDPTGDLTLLANRKSDATNTSNVNGDRNHLLLPSPA